MHKTRLIAIGDIHGCYNKFYQLVNDRIKLTKNDRLVLLGDYIDRGDQSKEVIDFIIHLLKEGFNVFPLKGNHEELLMQAYQNTNSIPKWIINGGQKTLDSFGIKDVRDISIEYIQFFKNLRFYYSIKKFLFVHAGFNDIISNPFEDENDMLWVCNNTYSNKLLRDKIIIHGHCPITKEVCKTAVINKDKVINIDTGCVYADKNAYGTLTAYDCNNDKLYFA